MTAEPFSQVANDSFRSVWAVRWKTFLTLMLVLLGIGIGLTALYYYRGLPIQTSDALVFVMIFGTVILAFFGVGIMGVLLSGLSAYMAQGMKMREVHVITRPPYTVSYIAFMVLTALSALWAGIASYHGMQMLFYTPDQGIRYYAMPALAGVFLAVAVFAFWAAILNAIGRAAILQRFAILFIAVPVGCMFIFIASTAPSVMGVGGDAATAFHMIESVEQQQTALNSTFNQRVTDIVSTTPMIRQVAERYRTRAKDEEVTGNYSQSRGVGQVSAYLNDVANGFEHELNELNEQETALRAKYASLNDQLKDLRDGLQQRGESLQNDMRTMIADLNVINSEIQNMSDTVVLKSTLVNIENIGKTQPLQAGSDDNALADRQNLASKRIWNDLKQDSDRVAAALKERISLPSNNVPKFEPISAVVAVIVYWKEVWMSWGVAIGADFSPFILVVLSMIIGGRAVKYEEVEPAPRAENTPHPESDHAKPELRVAAANG